VSTPPPPLVVGAVIIHAGRLLAARRVGPAALAGGWEFPGGKVEAGESAEAACVRECAEELGVLVRVVAPLGPDVPVLDGWRLRLFEARLEQGDPLPGADHDALRWLAPEELHEVDWLPGDRPLLPALREVLLAGEPLVGGNVGGAVRIGGTVRRPSGPWTPAVHALLDYLHSTGWHDVPRALGVDERGREVLSYLPGDTLEGVDRVSDEVTVDAMRWLAHYHAAVRDFRPAGLSWRSGRTELAADEIVCHNDFAPYNIVACGERVVGVFDWDIAGPGLPIDDVAFAAWNFVPLWGDTSAVECARRLRLLCWAYGGLIPHDVLDAVAPRIERMIDLIAAGQQDGEPGMVNLARIGEPDHTRRALSQLVARTAEIRHEL
jgi:8-oxo-dGTP pyrophosphatase MutT (NUDIX family)